MANVTIESLLKTVGIDSKQIDADKTKNSPALVLDGTKNEWTIAEEKQVNDGERLLSSLVAALSNLVPPGKTAAEVRRTDDKGNVVDDLVIDKPTIQSLVKRIDQMVNDQINAILHHENFVRMEATWKSIHDLVRETNFKADIDVNLLDVSKEEAYEDLNLNIADIGGSELFKKIYIAEYDQFGGHPYGGLIGLYEFDKSEEDLTWLEGIGKIARLSHAPFIGAAAPELFGVKTFAEVNQLRDIEGTFDTPAYSKWKKLRNTKDSVYVGLTLPRYLARSPYDPVNNPAKGINFTEEFDLVGDPTNKDVPLDVQINRQYPWANAAMLFAQKMVKSFENSGWCQYLRGVKGGGLCEGLSSHTFNVRGEDEQRGPVEVSIPDFRELQLAKAGFIPLIHKKGSSDAVFYSAQALKRPLEQFDPKDAENQQLASNLTYTLSVSRIAHYLKAIMRDNIGSNADATYISSQIDRWISKYVTTIVNPDDLTLRYYPFRAYSLSVVPIPGKIGWYKCDLSILPHIQFEGLDVDLRVDARLGA